MKAEIAREVPHVNGGQNVLPCPVAHALTVSACRRIWLISAAASRRSARFGDSATIRSQARSGAASSGQRARPVPHSVG